MSDNVLLDVQNLKVEYKLKGKKTVSAVSDVSLQVMENEILAPQDGTVKSVVTKGSTVNTGDILVGLE